LRIRYTRQALDDLISVLESVAVYSPQGAKRIQSRIRTLIDLLRQYPFLGSRTNDPEIRRLTTNPYPYLVFYQVTRDTVIIHAVRHGAQNPTNMPGFNEIS
jgi:plasmid stabilization system protein ParE